MPPGYHLELVASEPLVQDPIFMDWDFQGRLWVIEMPAFIPDLGPNRRSAELDADRITVETKGSEVILTGTVRSWAERQEAERAAWAAPGVTMVRNQLSVSPA